MQAAVAYLAGTAVEGSQQTGATIQKRENVSPSYACSYGSIIAHAFTCTALHMNRARRLFTRQYPIYGNMSMSTDTLPSVCLKYAVLAPMIVRLAFRN